MTKVPTSLGLTGLNLKEAVVISYVTKAGKGYWGYLLTAKPSSSSI
jgi:hypothetical protein